jgi:hypothetical protein
MRGCVVADDPHGELLTVTQRTMGDFFETNASIGDRTLNLLDVTDFDEDGGGYCLIGGNVYFYDSADMEADTIHLSSGLTTAALAGDEVDLWDFDNSVVVSEMVALVAVPDQDGDPTTAEVDYSLSALLAQTTLARGQSVSLAQEGSGHRVVAIHGKDNAVALRSTSTTTQVGVDDGAGNVYGLIIATGGTVVRVGTLGDFRVKTPDGATYMPVLASAFTISSDPGGKTHPTPAPDALAVIEAAPAMCWRYLSDGSKVTRIGPMADAVQKAAGWAVEVDEESGGALGLDLARMNGILWAAFGQQVEINKALDARITKLEKGAP